MQTTTLRGGNAASAAAKVAPLNRVVFFNRADWALEASDFAFRLTVWSAAGELLGEARLDGVRGLSRFEASRWAWFKLSLSPEPSVSLAVLESAVRAWARRHHESLDAIVTHELAHLAPDCWFDAINAAEGALSW